MQLRSYCQTDIPELASLVNESDRACYEFIPHTEEALKARLKGASYVVLALDEQDRVHGLAYLSQDWWGETVTLHTPLQPQRPETISSLLSGVEPQSQTGSLTALVDATEHELLALFAASGYQTQSTSYHMVAELDRSRLLPQVPEGYVMRNLRPHEEQALIRLANTAYRTQRLQPGILTKWRTEDFAFNLDCVKVAQHETDLVAVVVARSDDEYNRYYHARRGYLGPAATLPAHSGKGLSKALTAAAMNSLRDRGMHTVCLHTWQTNQPALAVTQGLGFRPAHKWAVLHKRLHLLNLPCWT